ncbi:MAG: class I SAM-dependent methyltransferase [Desulfomonile tiedjei]|nr:class I SAM-dependent methyltransferase [Desulfomonile tiedjei]
MIKRAIHSAFRAFGFDVVRAKTLQNASSDSDQSLSQVKQETSEMRERGHRPCASDGAPEIETGPAMLAPKTFNPNHPSYDATVVRNFPGCFFNVFSQTSRTESSRANVLFQHFLREKTMTLCGPGPDNYDFMADHVKAWTANLGDDPDYRNFQEKVKDLEDFISYLNASFPGSYASGSVADEDGMFLYYVVRLLRPKSIVQTGVSNGSSCSYMTLALKHNGDGGRLHAIDIPAVYDPDDPSWQQPRPYGVCIPPGRSSGWLVPDGLKSSFDCWNGDAKELLPKLLEDVGSVDMFYHDSDHSYDHMWFEFNAALPYMTGHGLIIADDIAWNSSTWDFAQAIGCYALNHRGSQGVIFL